MPNPPAQSSTNIQFGIKGIAEILKGKSLEVPLYQRSYAWERKQVEDLLADIFTAMTEKQEEYFLGSVVMLQDGKTFEVVDGQQRLATCTIILAAIRDYFKDRNDDHFEDIERDFLISRARRTQEVTPHLRLNSIDHEFFRSYVLTCAKSADRRLIQTTTDSHKNLKLAAKLAKDWVQKLASLNTDPAEALLDCVDFLENQAQVIRVQVPDGANAFTIFETLNDRGLDLAISDLLKNFLFKKADNRINEALQYWTNMLGALSAVDAEKYTVGYIRHVWAAEHGLIRERELYESIKDKTTSKQSAINFVKLLSDSAKFYAAILNPSSEVWADYGETTRRHIKTLQLLRMTQMRPLLLAILRSFGKKDVQQSLKLLVSWAVRFLLAGKLGSSDLENFYASKAKEVTTKKINNYAQLRTQGAAAVPTDAQFKTAFAAANVSSAYLARYYLQALENSAAKASNPELIPDDNPDHVNLEHILPQNPDASWKIDKSVLDTHLTKLGNLVLISSVVNSKIGNISFAEKKKSLAKSEIKLTKDVAAIAKWGRDEIEARQLKLADLAVKTWRI
jgi:hypothetical protein